MGLAFAALGCSLAVGLALNTLVALVVRTIQAGHPTTGPIDLGGAPALTLLIGTLLACLAAAVITWRALAPTRSPYRQGMLAMVSFFGSFALSMVAWPVDRAFGRPGLVGLILVAAALAIPAARRIARELATR